MTLLAKESNLGRRQVPVSCLSPLRLWEYRNGQGMLRKKGRSSQVLGNCLGAWDAYLCTEFFFS